MTTVELTSNTQFAVRLAKTFEMSAEVAGMCTRKKDCKRE
jgi:hypothetical protein